jgi:hypothetical protein
MPAEDEARESRIHNEIVVDCYTEEERVLGWYYYLDDRLAFPFKASCVVKLATSPLRLGEEVQVIGLASEDECRHDMLVRVKYSDSVLAVPLRQLRCLSRSRRTKEAMQDWHYWCFRGYEF